MAPILRDGRTTDPKLLERVRDWRDSHAWARFVSHYEPHLRAVCRVYGLAGASADDCCQHVWIKLASAMRRFHYDPGRGFRRWIHVYFHCRVRDMIRAARRHGTEVPMTEDMALGLFHPERNGDAPHDPEIVAMLLRAQEVQDAVRARITPENWDVFRLIGIEGRPIADTATFLGRQYTSVYRAYKRVSRMIAEERRRRDGLAEDAPLHS